MNILLVRPKPDKETIGLQNVMICEPLELMTLKPVLEKNGHRVFILDMIIEKKPLGYYLMEYQPDMVGITGYISHIGVILAYAKQCKMALPQVKVAVGGVHATVCPGDFKSPDIDLIASTADDFYRFTGCADRTPMLPDRELPEKYRKRYYYMFHRNCALIKTSFGCPYRCSFCFCRQIAPYSARPITDVLDELEQIKQKEVYIVDDDFLFDRERLLAFAQGVEQKKLNQQYLVYGRADFIARNEDIIERLSGIGLRAVIVGLEAADQKQLDNFNKQTKLNDNMEAVRILKKWGVECYATVILGIEWDKRDFQKLYRFLKGLNIVFVNLQPLTPMPQTALFDEYANRLVIPYNQYEKWDMAHLVVKPEKLSVRRYYGEIVKLYVLLMFNPGQGIYMIRRYGLKDTLKLSLGASKVAMQYVSKIIRGDSL